MTEATSKEKLTQPQLNAGIVIDGLSRLIAINTDPRFGWGADTLALVRDHVRGLELHSKIELRAALDRILNEPNAVDGGSSESPEAGQPGKP